MDFTHLFDGYGMLVRVSIDAGKATFQHRFVQSEAYKAFKATGTMKVRPAAPLAPPGPGPATPRGSPPLPPRSAPPAPQWREFGTPLQMAGPLDAARELARMTLGLAGAAQGVTDNASVNVVSWDKERGTGVAMTENFDGFYEVDLASLDTLGRVPWKFNQVPGMLTTAHPSRLATGEWLNIANDAGGKGVTLFKHTSGDADRQAVAPAVPHRKGRWASWIHDFPASTGWAVVPQYPIYMDLVSIVSQRDVGKGFSFLEWRPEDGALYTAVKLDGSGEVRTFKMPTHFCYHFGNCFEDGEGNLVFDASVYDDAEASLRSLVLRGDDVVNAEIPASRFVRFSLPLSRGGRGEDDACLLEIPEPLAMDALDGAWEFPAVNNGRRGGPTRYSWGNCARRPARYVNAIAKMDSESGEAKVWHDWGSIPMEPCFVPRPGATEEDDGVVLSMVSGAAGTAFLVVLDAASMEELARCHVDFALPYGFHGNWFP